MNVSPIKILKHLTHPIGVFVIMQIVWLTTAMLWIIWFIGQIDEITQLAKNIGRALSFDARYALIVMIVGCILLWMLFVGIIVLFVVGQKKSALMNQQNRFISSVTHELRSPLASLRLNLETLQSRKLDQNLIQDISQMALDDVERLSRLVSQILLSAGLDKGINSFTEEIERVDLAKWLKETALNSTWLEHNLEERLTILCQKDLSLDIPLFALSMIFTNLLENAIKYSPKESPIEVKAYTRGDFFYLNVCDQGSGISKKDLKKIFKIFYRSPSALTAAIPGTGLGLYIVSSMTALLKGKVEASSPGPEKGSSFLVTLPINTSS